MGLKLTYEVNTTDFLDVKLDLRSEEFKPYMKPNDKRTTSASNPTTRPLYSRIFLPAYAIVFRQIPIPKPSSDKQRPPILKH